MDEMKLPSFRSLDDFIFSSSRFGLPDFQNKERWNNRIVQNLLYYQTNYLAVAFPIFLLILYFFPKETLFGGIIAFGLLFAMIYLSNNRYALRQFKRDYPLLVIVSAVSLSMFLMYLVGSIAVFIFSIALPLLVILLHASFRLRNLRNKILNKTEMIGLKKTPMGVILRTIDNDMLSIF